MPAETYSVRVGIDASPAAAGAAQFRAATGQIATSSQVVDTATARTRKAFNRTGSTILRVRALLVGFGAAFTLAAAIREIGSFEQAMADVEALLGPRAVGGAIENMTQLARELGATTVFSAKEAAEGLKFLTLAGFDAEESIQALPSTLALASAGALDLGSAADITSNIMAGFRLEAEQTGRVADVLAATSARSNTNVTQLGQAMKFVAPVAAAANVNLEQTSAAMGILGNAGLQASLAGTSLRTAITKILNPSDRAQEALKRINITVEDLQVELEGERGLIGAIRLLADAGLDAGSALQIFQQRGGPGILALTSQIDDLEELYEVLQNVEGAADEMARIRLDTVAGSFEVLRAALAEVALQAGDNGLSGTLRGFAETVAGAITALNGMVDVFDGEMHPAFERGIEFVEKYNLSWQGIVNTLQGGAIIVIGLLVTSLTTKLVTALAGARGALIAFRTTVIATGASLTTLTAFMTTLFAPIVGLVAVGALAWVAFRGSTDDADDSLKDLNDTALISVEVFSLLGNAQQIVQLNQLRERIEAVDAAIAENNETISEQTELISLLETHSIRYIRDHHQNLRGVLAPWKTKNELIKEAEQNILELTAENEGLISSNKELIARQEEYVTVREEANHVETEAERIAREAREAEVAKAKALGETITKIYEITDALGVTNTKTEEYREQIKTLEDQIKLLRAEGDLYEQEIQEATDAIEILTINMQLSEMQASALEEAQKRLNEALGGTTDSTEELTEAMQKLVEQYVPGQRELKAYQDALLLMVKASESGVKVSDEFREALRVLREAYVEATTGADEAGEATDEFGDTSEEVATEVSRQWKQATRGIQDAFADFFEEGLDGFEDFGEAIVDTIKRSIAEILAAFATSKIAEVIANLFPQQTARLSNTFGFELPEGSRAQGVIDAARKRVQEGLSDSVGDAISERISEGGGGFGGNISGILRGGFEGVKNAISNAGSFLAKAAPVALPLIGIGLLIRGLLGSTRTAISSLRVNVDGEDVTGTRTDRTTTRKLFRSTKTEYSDSDLDLSAFQTQLLQLRASLQDAANSLGFEGYDFEDYKTNRSVYGLGYGDEETSERFEEALDSILVANIRAFIFRTRGFGEEFKELAKDFGLSSEDFIERFNILVEQEKQRQAELNQLREDTVRQAYANVEEFTKAQQELLRAEKAVRDARTEADILAAGEALEEIIRAQRVREEILDVFDFTTPLEKVTEAFREAGITGIKSLRRQAHRTRLLANHVDDTIISMKELGESFTETSAAAQQLIIDFKGVVTGISEAVQGARQRLVESQLTESQIFNLRQRELDTQLKALRSPRLFNDPEDLQDSAARAIELVEDLFNRIQQNRQTETNDLAGVRDLPTVEELIGILDEIETLTETQAQAGIDAVDELTAEFSELIQTDLQAAADTYVGASEAQAAVVEQMAAVALVQEVAAQTQREVALLNEQVAAAQQTAADTQQAAATTALVAAQTPVSVSVELDYNVSEIAG